MDRTNVSKCFISSQAGSNKSIEVDHRKPNRLIDNARYHLILISQSEKCQGISLQCILSQGCWPFKENSKRIKYKIFLTKIIIQNVSPLTLNSCLFYPFIERCLMVWCHCFMLACWIPFNSDFVALLSCTFCPSVEPKGTLGVAV